MLIPRTGMVCWCQFGESLLCDFGSSVAPEIPLVHAQHVTADCKESQLGISRKLNVLIM
jgi:uncharacterized protein YifN (PemK superfamily)